MSIGLWRYSGYQNNSTLFVFFLFFEWENVFLLWVTEGHEQYKKTFEHSKKREKKWTDYFFKFYREQNSHYYLENTGKI